MTIPELKSNVDVLVCNLFFIYWEIFIGRFLYHSSSATVFAQAVSTTANFKASATKISFLKSLSVNNTILTYSESLFSNLLSSTQNILTYSFQCGHFPA